MTDFEDIDNINLELFDVEPFVEDWERYHEAYLEKLADEGLDYYDEQYYNVWRQEKISCLGEAIKEEESPNQGVLVESLQKALIEERRIADEARGKTFRLSDKNRELRRKLDIYLTAGKQMALQERAEELAQKRGERLREKERSVMDNILARLPPQELTLERIVLGMYLADPKLTERFLQKYLNKMWYADANKQIHSALIDLGTKGDRRVLVEELKRKGQLEAVGGEAYIDELEAFGRRGNSDSIGDYVEILEEKFLRRELIHWCSGKIREAYDGELSPYDEKGNKRDKEESQITNWTEHIRQSSAHLLELLPYRFLRRFSTPTLVDEVVEDFNGLVIIGKADQKLLQDTGVWIELLMEFCLIG